MRRRRGVFQAKPFALLFLYVCGFRAGDKSTDTCSDESVASRDIVDGRLCEQRTCLPACGVVNLSECLLFFSVVFVQHRCFFEHRRRHSSLWCWVEGLCNVSFFRGQESRPCSISCHVKARDTIFDLSRVICGACGKERERYSA